MQQLRCTCGCSANGGSAIESRFMPAVLRCCLCATHLLLFLKSIDLFQSRYCHDGSLQLFHSFRLCMMFWGCNSVGVLLWPPFPGLVSRETRSNPLWFLGDASRSEGDSSQPLGAASAALGPSRFASRRSRPHGVRFAIDVSHEGSQVHKRPPKTIQQPKAIQHSNLLPSKNNIRIFSVPRTCLDPSPRNHF